MFLRQRHILLPSISSLVLLGCWTSLDGKVVPHALFSSHAVLQKDMEVPVWGTADAGEKVTVSFAGQSHSTTAADGRWMVKLQPMKANSEPRTMTINSIELTDILVGEVWLCGGQSNMEWALAKSSFGRSAAMAVKAPMIRLFKVPTTSRADPADNVNSAWEACEHKAAASFSGVAYFFGRDLQKALGVPIGLIGSYVGGTPAEKWISEKALSAHPDLKPMVERQRRMEAAYDPAKARASHEAALEKHQKAAAAAKDSNKKPPLPPQKPGDPKGRGVSSLYNGMIAPLQPCAIRGVIWYQGESNRGNPAQYAKLFPALISDWRSAWQRELPFLFVQIAPFSAVPPELREAQTLTWKNTPKTGMVVITDHGSASNIHPPAKEPVGSRLALAARAVAYGEKITWSGPVYQSMNARGSKIAVRFGSTGTGLIASGQEGKPKGFTIAGADGKFLPADALIQDNTVLVSHPDIAKPTAVRYGWSNVPDVDLFNREGLPAVPFRSDTP